MFDRHEQLADFSLVLSPSIAIDEMVSRLRATSASHIRLQHFPVETAKALWRKIQRDPFWK